jgi:hypothetical protein
MELTVLTVPGCPNAAAFEERLTAALAGYPGAVVRCRQVADEQEAAEAGMAGSPTLLIDGADPFAVPGQVPGLSCRLYRDAAGRPAGAPSVEDLRRALERAGADGQPA